LRIADYAKALDTCFGAVHGHKKPHTHAYQYLSLSVSPSLRLSVSLSPTRPSPSLLRGGWEPTRVSLPAPPCLAWYLGRPVDGRPENGRNSGAVVEEEKFKVRSERLEVRSNRGFTVMEGD